jgi:acyl carrier protein
MAQATTVTSAGPATGTERSLAEVLAEVVRVERVSVDSHFFEDLGADSMVMAQFCARVRKRPELSSVSMKDVYRHPTIRSLATALAGTTPTPAGAPAPAPAEVQVPAPVGTAQYVLCGTLQALFYLGYAYLAALIMIQGYVWVSASAGVLDGYLRSASFGGAMFLGMCILPILAKWVLIGRWKPRQIPIWSLAYLRFWIVKTLVQANPVLFFLGSPLYLLYLRALGASIGRGVVILSRHVPVCTDLLTVGAGTVIRKDSFFTCYRAHAGLIQPGAVTLGKDVLVSESTVLDIGTSMGDGAQLGHASSLHTGQAVPAGGATAVADSPTVLDALPTELVDRFEREGWLLTRSYNDEIGASFAEAFGTEDRGAVERYCRANAIEFAWQPDGELRTRQRRSAVVRHPVTGQRCWFNQIPFLNEWTIAPEIREYLVDVYGADGLPFNTRYGNGDPIGQDVVELLNKIYEDNTAREPWQAGDLLLVDNVRTAHSREPFQGPREVLVAMADPVRLADCSPTVEVTA